MKIKKTKGERAFTVFNTLFLIAVSLVCLYPIIYVVLASVSDSNLLMRYSGALYRPLGFNLNAYVKVFENPMIIIGYKNTMFVLIVGLAVSMVLSILGAYFLSRQDVYFKTPIMILILVTMYFSGGIVPLYLTVRSLGMADSLWALILPSAISTYNMIILRTGFASIPRSLDEAATIDGANPFTILWRIYIPLSKATIAVIFLYYAVAKWNSWFDASIYLDSRAKYPLQLVLREILISNDTGTRLTDASMGDMEAIGLSIKYATIVVSTLPILVVYPFIQKYFVKGVMIGSLKG